MGLDFAVIFWNAVGVGLLFVHMYSFLRLPSCITSLKASEMHFTLYDDSVPAQVDNYTQTRNWGDLVCQCSVLGILRFEFSHSSTPYQLYSVGSLFMEVRFGGLHTNTVLVRVH